MNKILIIGSNGQLGNCLKKISEEYLDKFEFHFTSSSELDITNVDSIENYFESLKPHYCINASAYTAVDKAEEDSENAFNVNAVGVGLLAEICKNFNTELVHVSTDYVFDGDTEMSYSEDNFTNPVGIYGKSKLAGEELAIENNPKTIILRTSWLYSEFNKNFVKTMLSLFSTKKEIGVVGDQYGQPTNANDLARAIMDIITSSKREYGVFHFSNYPETTWFDFAKKIAEFSNSEIQVNSLTTEEYPTLAKRPKRSTMDLDKIERVYGIEPIHWENSLENCLQILKTN